MTFLLFPTQVYLAYLVDRRRLPFGFCSKSRVSTSSTVEKATDDNYNSGNEDDNTTMTATVRSTLRSTISGSQSSSGYYYYSIIQKRKEVAVNLFKIIFIHRQVTTIRREITAMNKQWQSWEYDVINGRPVQEANSRL